jgi:hypothetical protein
MGSLNRSAGIVLLFLILCLAASVAAATGTIQITVNPGGGTVCLDTVCKEDQGTTDASSSTTFENVQADCYHMLNIYGTPGYEPYMGQVFLDSSGKTITREITLKKIPASAPETSTLKVFITPDGGKACLDRMCELSSGDRTGSWSVQFHEVIANTYHTLSISNDGYETFTTEVRLLPGQTNMMSVTLEPLPPASPTVPTLPPTPTLPTPTPQPTRADLPGFVALIATGICGIVWVIRKT